MTATLQRQRRKDARPQELLDAALSLFVEKGFAATKAEEVATLAGVSKGTLYLYFPSKEELLKAVIRHTLSADIAQGRERLLAHQGSASEALLHLLPEWWETVYDSPNSGVFKLVVTEVRNFPEIAEFYAREVVEPGIDVIGQLLQRGVAQGEFRADLDIRAAVQSVVLPMIMLCLHKHSLGPCLGIASILPEPRQLIRSHMSLLLQGLRAPAAPKTRKTR
jgi:AcrR family transcriptional regulator